MRTETITRTLYKFDELSESAQTRAVERLWDLNVSYDWFDSVYKDARMIGAEIRSFDAGRGNSIELKFNATVESVIGEIIRGHGPECETAKLARSFDAVLAETEDAETRDELAEEFRQSLGEEYLTMLRREYEYLTSREAIIESIEANEYEFTENGDLS